MGTIGFIGSGNMAEALIKGIISAGLYSPADILISDVCGERLTRLAGEYGVRPAESNPGLCACAEVIVLSVKPRDIIAVLEEIQGALKTESLVISIAAGVRNGTIARYLGEVPIIRAMPNTPVMVGHGATAIVAKNTSPGHLELSRALFTAVGTVEVLRDEDLIDAVTAVSGSGPAYFFLLMEEMISAAIRLGLSEDMANELVLQTAKGSGRLAELAYTRSQSPAELRGKVTSPGGTTEAAVKVFQSGDFSGLVTSALTAARSRSREMSELFSNPG